MKEFDDVINCKDIAELNLFIREYLKEKKLIADGFHKETTSTFWALCYRWFESI